MNSMSAGHSAATYAPGSIRVSVRASAGHFHKEIDVSLPEMSSLDESLDEVMDLMDAPAITRPWRASTAAGRPLDHSVPLRDTPVVDGSVLLVRPQVAVPAPVIRDSAEALAAAAHTNPAVPLILNQLSCLSGLAVMVALAAGWAGWPLALALGALTAVIIHLFQRSLTALAPTAIACAAAACALFIAHGQLSFILCVPAAALVTLVLHAARLGSTTLWGAVTAISTCALSAGVGGFLPGLGSHVLAAAASGLAALIVIIMVAPGLSARLAGLRVPQLPTAGDDLSISDVVMDDVEARAAAAHQVYSGLMLGCLLGSLPCAWVLSAANGGRGFALILCLVFALTLALHGSRQGNGTALWAFMGMAMVWASAAGVMAFRAMASQDYFWPVVSFGALAGIMMTTAPLWSQLLGRIEPTTAARIEKAEFVALALLFPLAMHLMGIFALIRGLG